MNKNNKNTDMKGKSLLVAPEDNELFNLTDSENSSTSSNDQVFENQTVVLELHGLQRDELPDNPLPEVKTRKLLKKKRPSPQPEQDPSAGSLTSSSESFAVPPGPEKLEEFFDAHESYYEFPDNQSSAITDSPLNVESQQMNPKDRPQAAQLSPEDKRTPETPGLSATTAAVTQETATGQTPLTSAKPIRSRNPE